MTTTLADPFLVGDGPATFSTSRALVRHYPMIWDVNGYYRELGVSPYATKVQIKWAYRKKKGWRSPRLTYIMKQLLNPSIRRLYDSTPFGEVFWDRYVEDAVRKAAVARATQLRKQGRLHEAEVEMEFDSPFSDLEDDLSQGSDRLARARSRDHNVGGWPWAYYLWQSPCRDTARLARWQESLCEVLGERKETLEMAVGFLGGVERAWEVRKVGYRIVAFLSDGAQPTEVLARAAASRVSELAREG